MVCYYLFRDYVLEEKVLASLSAYTILHGEYDCYRVLAHSDESDQVIFELGHGERPPRLDFPLLPEDHKDRRFVDDSPLGDAFSTIFLWISDYQLLATRDNLSSRHYLTQRLRTYEERLRQLTPILNSRL